MAHEFTRFNRTWIHCAQGSAMPGVLAWRRSSRSAGWRLADDAAPSLRGGVRSARRLPVPGDGCLRSSVVRPAHDIPGRSRSGSPSTPAAFRPISCRRATREECAAFVQQRFAAAQISHFGVRVHGAGEYPEKLRDATHPIEFLYYQGWWDLVGVPIRLPSSAPAIRRPTASLGRVGSRANSSATTSPLYRDWPLASIGLPHDTAIEHQGRTIAVIGTPLSRVYPKDHEGLQRYIADHFLVVSPVPVKRYESQDYRRNRFFFPGAQRRDVRPHRGDHHRRRLVRRPGR